MAKVKKVKLPLGDGGRDMAEMFNQILGAGNVNMNIAYPRYTRLRSITEQIISVMELLANSPFMKKYGEYAGDRAELLAWCQSSRGAAQVIFSADFSDYEWDLTLVEEEQVAQFSELYEAMKKSPLIKSFIIMCDRLVLHKTKLAGGAAAETVPGRFIDLMPGVSWTPFPFSNLNIKYIFAQHGDDITRRFFLVVLAKAYELSHKVWGEITSPDVDMEEFSSVIISNISEIQKMPELSRCGRAFKKIEESIGLLNDRFGSYYRDFIQTKNTSIIMEHFIIDVSKESGSDPETTRQFREIIKFYRKQAQSNIKDPKVRAMFDKVNASFNEIERDTANLVNIRDNEEVGAAKDDEGTLSEVTMVGDDGEEHTITVVDRRCRKCKVERPVADMASLESNMIQCSHGHGPRTRGKKHDYVEADPEMAAARERAATKTVDELAAEIG